MDGGAVLARFHLVVANVTHAEGTFGNGEGGVAEESNTHVGQTEVEGDGGQGGRGERAVVHACMKNGR